MPIEKPTLTLSNCKFAFPCPKTWEALQKTDDESVRFCDTCEHCVYLCSTDEELNEATRRNRCVAIRMTDADGGGGDGLSVGNIEVSYLVQRD